MVLADKKIKKEIKKGNIVIFPYDERNVGTNSYDVRLGKTLAVYDDEILDAKKPPTHRYFDIPVSGCVLKPGELYLGSVKEYISSPKYLPWIDGRSSVGRLGISVHVTAGKGDRGWKGHLTLEITAVKPVRIYADMLIAQVTFFKTTEPSVLYCDKPNANYNTDDIKPTPSRLWRSFMDRPSDKHLDTAYETYQKSSTALKS